MCGKNKIDVVDALIDAGSPPRVREKRLALVRGSPRLGITPACAGKTQRTGRR